mmetsp:Transcript_31530/g.94335  ORF Transcript_31530/g.94335 Transcript_31530/m.94335 type:complete len:152 (-) Transcript_31530:73-528(-)
MMAPMGTSPASAARRASSSASPIKKSSSRPSDSGGAAIILPPISEVLSPKRSLPTLFPTRRDRRRPGNDRPAAESEVSADAARRARYEAARTRTAIGHTDLGRRSRGDYRPYPCFQRTHECWPRAEIARRDGQTAGRQTEAGDRGRGRSSL